MSTQPNFVKIETVTTGYFAYIVGRFVTPDVHVLGVMDLNDPASWSGGETAVTYYFLITPEEFAWLETDREKLDELAKTLQTNMPRSRFYSCMSRNKVDPQQLRATTEAALKEDSLENDEVFAEWKKTVNFPKVIRVPATPFNRARHALAVKQKGFDPKTASEEDKAEEEKLEKELGWLIFKADEIFVAYDTCFNENFPFLEPMRGDVHIFSTEEIANNSVKFYEEKKFFFTTIKRIEQKDIKAFLRSCEDLGVLVFRIDDGVEQCEVKRVNIIPDSPAAFIEERNNMVRNVMLRTLQNGQLLRKHGEEMEAEWKKGIGNWFLTWQRSAYQDLGNTLFYVPVALPEQLRDQLEGNIPFTAAAMTRTQELLQKAKKPSFAINHPSFKGKNVIVNAQEGKLPIRLIKNNQTEESWMVAFTSRGPAEAFAKRSAHNDTIITMTFDELVAQRESCAGIVVDVTGMGMILRAKEIDTILEVRTQGRVIYRSKPAEQPENTAAPAQPAEEEKLSVSVESEPVVVLPEDQEMEVEVDDTGDGEEKKGFFGKLFGKK